MTNKTRRKFHYWRVCRVPRANGGWVLLELQYCCRYVGLLSGLYSCIQPVLSGSGVLNISRRSVQRVRFWLREFPRKTRRASLAVEPRQAPGPE